MAIFDEAIVKTLAREGGSKVTEIDGDSGGLTKYGISQRSYPNEDIRNLSEARAREIYRRDYWNRVNGDNISNQAIAESIFDFAVNAGPVTSMRLAQVAVGITQPEKTFTSSFIVRINSANEHDFLASFALAKIARYASICNKDRTQSKFLLGWINRTLGGM